MCEFYMDYKLEKYLNKLQNIEYDKSHPSYSIYMEKYTYYLSGGVIDRDIYTVFIKFINMMLQRADHTYQSNMINNVEQITNDFNEYIIKFINKKRYFEKIQPFLPQTIDQIKKLIVVYSKNKTKETQKQKQLLQQLQQSMRKRQVQRRQSNRTPLVPH